MNRIEEFSELINSVDSPVFLKKFANIINDLSKSCFTTIFIYSKNNISAYVYDNFNDQKHKEAVKIFLNKTYILNPFYQKYLRGIKPGLYMPKDLEDTKDGNIEKLNASTMSIVEITDEEELGYLTYNWPMQLSEIDIAIPLKDGRMVEVGVYRESNQARFDDDYPIELDKYYPLLKSCFNNFWQLNQHRFEYSQTKLFMDFFAILSNREGEVINLILKGHSSESIGLILGISITTVKSHRKSSYQKLNISTQAELMYTYLSYLHKNFK